MSSSSQLRLQTVPLSSSSPSSSSVKVERISDNLSFRPASSAHPGPSSAHLDDSQRPIVVIYAWLAAKSRHIHKFGDFYQGVYLLTYLLQYFMPCILVWQLLIVLRRLTLGLDFGRPFVKRFALCYWTVVCLSVCLSVTLVYCGQTVGWIKMPLGMEVGLGPSNVLYGDPTTVA